MFKIKYSFLIFFTIIILSDNMEFKDNVILNNIIDNEFFKKDLNNLDVFLKYISARIDIKNYGNENNNLEILNISDENATIDYPLWYKGKEGKGVIIHSIKGVIDIKIKCINDGYLSMFLRGFDFIDKRKKRTPIFIDFIKLIINGKCIFDSRVTVCHDLPYNFIIDKVEDGEILDIHIEWEPFSSNSISIV